MPPDPIDRLNLLPLTDDSFSREDMLRSKLFADEFDPAILGTTVNERGRRVVVYDEEILIDLMLEQLRDDADEGEEPLWEDAAASITYRLDLILMRMGEWAPMVV